MIISSESIKLNFYEEPKFIIGNSKKIEQNLITFYKFFDLKTIDVEVGFASRQEIKKINLKFRDINKETNVLSFPNETLETFSNQCNGEIIFCIQVIEEEAKKYQKEIIDHFLHLLFHSLLHLIGYMHEQERDAILMEEKEITFLSKIGINNPYL